MLFVKNFLPLKVNFRKIFVDLRKKKCWSLFKRLFGLDIPTFKKSVKQNYQGPCFAKLALFPPYVAIYTCLSVFLFVFSSLLTLNNLLSHKQCSESVCVLTKSDNYNRFVLENNVLEFASTLNLKVGPPFTEVCLSVIQLPIMIQIPYIYSGNQIMN